MGSLPDSHLACAVETNRYGVTSRPLFCLVGEDMRSLWPVQRFRFSQILVTSTTTTNDSCRTTNYIRSSLNVLTAHLPFAFSIWNKATPPNRPPESPPS